ncbi:MAG: hypothetical protein WD011_04655 [Nitriliruptoraceae bacterium]
MMMSPGVRRFALGVHLSVSVGWIGAVLAYLALGVAAVTAGSEQTIRGAWLAMEIIGWYVIVPSAVAALATGVLMALGTPWGLIRHYWVLISLVLTSGAVAVLLLHMPDVSAAAELARTASEAELAGLGGDLVHATLGLLVLLTIQVINVAKPRGLTRYGARRRTSGAASRA